MKRRDFLKTSGIIASGTMLASSAWAFPVRRYDDAPLRVGVIGTGSRGTGLIRMMQPLAHLQVVAACDTLPFRLEAALPYCEEGVRSYERYQDLLNDEGVDAVIIATPLYLHHQMAVAAIDAGKHVYCEKTMTFHIEEALDLTAKVRASDKVFQVGHQYRSTPLYFKVGDMIRSGAIGEVLNVYIQWNRNADWRRFVPDPQYERQINWRMYREYSGGMTAELHSHQLDFVNYVFQSHPVEVMGMGGIDYWKDGRETFDNINTLFRYPSGMKVNCIALTTNSHQGYQVVFKGKKGTIEMDMTNAYWYSESRDEAELTMVDGVSGATATSLAKGEAVQIWARDEHEDWDNTRHALEHFYDRCQDGELPYSNVFNGAATAISVRLALDALHEGGLQSWQTAYDAAIQP